MPSLATIELVGEASGETIVNTFAYFCEDDITSDTDDVQSVFTEKWIDLYGEGLVNCHASTYTPLGVRGRLWGGLGGPLTYQYTERPVAGEPTLLGESAGPVVAAILSFDLKAIAYYTGLSLPTPKRGYLAWGPISEADINPDGRLAPTGANANAFEYVRNAVIQPVSDQAAYPFVWHAARLHRHPNGDPATASLASGAQWRNVISTRRSRKPHR